MPACEITIINKLGLHARAAASLSASPGVFLARLKSDARRRVWWMAKASWR